jgi:hypothetical protein
MKTISFGSAKNIGKKEKYYLKKYLYIIEKIPNFHNDTTRWFSFSQRLLKNVGFV